MKSLIFKNNNWKIPYNSIPLSLLAKSLDPDWDCWLDPDPQRKGMRIRNTARLKRTSYDKKSQFSQCVEKKFSENYINRNYELILPV